MQGITEGTSTTLEKKPFVDTIKEEILKNQTKKISGRANKNQNEPEKNII